MAVLGRALAMKLPDKDIEASLVRFEALYQQWSIRKVFRRPCYCCSHPDRIEINRALLTGKSYALIAKEFNIEDRFTVRNHWMRHLTYAIKMESGTMAEIMATTVERLSRIPFPYGGTRQSQLNWCIRNYGILREVELDKLRGESNPFFDFDMSGFLSAINRIRETVIILHDRRKASGLKSQDKVSPREREEKEEAWIPDEAKAMLEATANESKKRKGLEVDSNGNRNNGRQSAPAAPPDGLPHERA